jgi:hypothetical protein
MHKKSNNTLNAVLAVMAALLIVGTVGLFWVAWTGVKWLRAEAAHAATVIGGDASALAGKPEYVGTWVGGGMTLTIEAGGHVDYEKKEPGSSEAMHGSISFDGGEMVLDVLVMKKRMHIDKPPHLDGTRWLMTLDGVEVERP